MTNGPKMVQGRKAPTTIYEDVVLKRLDATPASKVAQLQKAEIHSGHLKFQSHQAAVQALRDGVFYLTLPPELDLSPTDQFAEQFFRGAGCKPYGHYREYPPETFGDILLGFHERSDQVEQFLLESRFWKTFPPEIEAIGLKLTQMSETVLSFALALAGLPEGLWDQATGGCLSQRGSYHFTFNHYRPDIEKVGLSSHKDDGFLTLLRIFGAGLEVNIDGQWQEVPTIKNTLVVNFGLSMELLTRKCQIPIAAILHRVRRQIDHRVSFGHFSSSRCDPGDDGGIFSFDGQDGLVPLCGSRDLIDANDYEIYNGTRQQGI